MSSDAVRAPVSAAAAAAVQIAQLDGNIIGMRYPVSGEHRVDLLLEYTYFTDPSSPPAGRTANNGSRNAMTSVNMQHQYMINSTRLAVGSRSAERRQRDDTVLCSSGTPCDRARQKANPPSCRGIERRPAPRDPEFITRLRPTEVVKESVDNLRRLIVHIPSTAIINHHRGGCPSGVNTERKRWRENEREIGNGETTWSPCRTQPWIFQFA